MLKEKQAAGKRSRQDAANDADSGMRVRWGQSLVVKPRAEALLKEFEAEQWPWTHRYAPAASTDIVGNAEARAAVQSWFANPAPRTLIVQGPCGCGKSLTVELELRSCKLNPVRLHAAHSRTASSVLSAARKAASLGVPLLLEDAQQMADEPTGLAALIRLVKAEDAANPLIVCIMDTTHNTPAEDKLRPLLTAPATMVVQLAAISTAEIVQHLHSIATAASIQLTEERAHLLAEAAAGDVRNAVLRLEFDGILSKHTHLADTLLSSKDVQLPSAKAAGAALVRGDTSVCSSVHEVAELEGAPFVRVLCTAIQDQWPYHHNATEPMDATCESIAHAETLLYSEHMLDEAAFDTAAEVAAPATHLDENNVAAQCACALVVDSMQQGSNTKHRMPAQLRRWTGRRKTFQYIP